MSHQQRNTCRTLGALGATCLVMAACRSGTPHRTEEPDTESAPASEATVPATPDPETFGPLPRPDLAADDPQASDAAAPTDQPPSDPTSDEIIPETGRPAWWFADARRSEGRVKLCAEVLGSTMLDVRRGVLDAARQRMRDELGLAAGAPIPGEVVERVWTTPLPTSRSGDVRYAGYALMAADAP